MQLNLEQDEEQDEKKIQNEEQFEFVRTLLEDLKLSNFGYAKKFIDNGYEKQETVEQVTLDELQAWNIRRGHAITIFDKIQEMKKDGQKKQQEIKAIQFENDIVLDLIVVGAPNVGKSSLLKYIIEHEFDENIGITRKKHDDKSFWIICRDRSVLVNIRDCAGQTMFYDQLEKHDMEDAFGSLAVCSVDYGESLEQLEELYLTKLRKNNPSCKIVIACNKYDMLDGEFKDEFKESMQQLKNDLKRINKNNNYKFYNVSAKTGHNVKVAFNELLNGAVSQYVENKEKNDIEEWKQIEKRCKSLTTTPGIVTKMVVFSVQGNSYDASGFYENQEIKWRHEKYKKKEIFYCYYEGNKFLIGSFEKECFKIWNNMDHETLPRSSVVQQMYKGLKEKKWDVVVFAIDVNKRFCWDGIINKQWNIKNDKIEVFVCC